MKGFIVCYGALIFTCYWAIMRPWIGVVGYFGFAVAVPTWLWRWSVPQDANLQKYIAAATLLGLLFSGLKGNRLKGAPAWAITCLVLYLGWAWLTSFFTISTDDSARYMDVIWKIILFICLGLVLIDTPKKLITLIWVIVIAQGYNAWVINEMYFQAGYCYAARSGWAYLDNNTYSIFTVPVMGLSVALTFYAEQFWQRVVAGVIFVLQMHEMMLLESRGTMIGSLVTAALAILFVRKTRWTVTTIAASLVAAGILAGPPVVKEFTSAFKPKGELDSSAESRYDLWKAGMAITKDYPIFGVGPNAGRRLVNNYYIGAKEDKALHNLFFDISTGSGIPGAIFYFGFFAFTFLPAIWLWIIKRHQLPAVSRIALFSIVCGVPGYMVSSMFSSGALIESGYVCTLVGTIALLVMDRESIGQPVLYQVYRLENGLLTPAYSLSPQVRQAD